jgi:hypothetical protein
MRATLATIFAKLGAGDPNRVASQIALIINGACVTGLVAKPADLRDDLVDAAMKLLAYRFANSSRSPRARDGHQFESPQLHQEVGANGPGFPAPTIPRLFSALAPKLMVCGVYSAGARGLGRRTRK